MMVKEGRGQELAREEGLASHHTADK